MSEQNHTAFHLYFEHWREQRPRLWFSASGTGLTLYGETKCQNKITLPFINILRIFLAFCQEIIFAHAILSTFLGVI